MAGSNRSRLGLLGIILFICICFILAATRAGSRLGAMVVTVIPFDFLRPSSTPTKATYSTSASPSSSTMTTSTVASSSFEKPPQAPPSFALSGDMIIEQAEQLCAESRSSLDKIVSEVTPETATFENVVLPMALHDNEAALQNRILGFFKYVSSDAAVRNASAKAEQILDDYSIEASMREDTYQLVEAVFQRGEKLEPESQRLLEKGRKSYIRAGLGIPAGEQRNTFKEIQERLNHLAIQFTKNLNEEIGGIWFTKEQLDGVPNEVLDRFEEGTGDREDMLRMTFKYPDYFPVTKYAKSNETRFKVVMEHDNNVNVNIPIFEEVIILRDQAARLLDYPDHATFRIEDKMAKSPKTVWDFLLDLKSRLAPGGRKEIDHLKEIKKADLESRNSNGTYDGNLYLWDNRFYDRMMIEEEYSIDSQKIAEYFPLKPTINNMFKIFETLFGLNFHELSDEQRVEIAENGQATDIAWHSEVKIFTVWDDAEQGGEFIGYLYLDLHPRPGKYGHAANFGLQPGFLFENGTRHYPVTALVCNFPKPSDTSPSLLQHSELTTLFHELGHGIHDLVSRTRFSHFHGTATVRDFVEAPSQMLENWCWIPSQLRLLSQHYLSGESLPTDVIDSLVKTKHVNDALFNLRQLHVGIYDMTIHTPKSHTEVKEMKFSEVYNELRTEISGLKGPEALGYKFDWGNGECTFGHLISGYDAGYYGYLASQVYSADMFHTVFKKDPMNPKEGRRYRHMVLEKGGSQDEMKTLEEFLGRKPNTKAFYRELGLEG